MTEIAKWAVRAGFLVPRTTYSNSKPQPTYISLNAAYNNVVSRLNPADFLEMSAVDHVHQ